MSGRPVADRVSVANIRREVLELRMAGMTFEQIAVAIKAKHPGKKAYTSGAAFTDAKRALADAQQELTDMASLHLALELGRLDTYRQTAEQIRQQALADGDGFLALRALDRLTAIGKRTDEMLGLTRVTVEATKVTESGGERPHVQDGVDEVARRRAARRIAASK